MIIIKYGLIFFLPGLLVSMTSKSASSAFAKTCKSWKTTNGILVWKISDFTQRQQEAISGKTPSLYSPPFYTSPAGYKVCARLYPNGDGIGKGTHLSLFFVVMSERRLRRPSPLAFQSESQLDASPPKHCQSEKCRRDISSRSKQFFIPPSSTKDERCPLFFPPTNLRSSSFLKDDTLFFKL